MIGFDGAGSLTCCDIKWDVKLDNVVAQLVHGQPATYSPVTDVAATDSVRTCQYTTLLICTT
jgi:hypothetical protein